jgi:hypothetical protein
MLANILEGARSHKSQLEPDSLSVILNPKNFPQQILGFMKSCNYHAATAVIAGSFVTALALEYLREPADSACPSFTPSDIDIFWCGEKSRSLRDMPVPDAEESCVSGYNFNMHSSDLVYNATHIYGTSKARGDLPSVQVIVFASNKKMNYNTKFRDAVIKFMDFTIVSSVIVLCPNTHMLELKINHISHLEKRELHLNPGAETHQERLDKWVSRGFKIVEPIKTCLRERAVGHQPRLAPGLHFRVSDSIVECMNSDARINRFNGLRDITITLYERLTNLHLSHTSGRIICLGNAMTLQCAIYTHDCELEIIGAGDISIVDFPHEIEDCAKPLLPSNENEYSRTNEIYSKITAPGMIVSVELSEDSDIRTIHYRMPDKSPEGAWVVWCPEHENGCEYYPDCKFVEKHKNEVYSGIIVPCNYEKTDAWYWKSPSYTANSNFNMHQLAHWTNEFLEFYNYSKFARKHIRASLRCIRLIVHNVTDKFKEEVVAFIEARKPDAQVSTAAEASVLIEIAIEILNAWDEPNAAAAEASHPNTW